MKLTNLKMYSLMMAVFVFFALTGCGGGTSSTSDAVTSIVPDATASTVTASPASVAADGTTTSTVTITVNDYRFNPITNASVSLDQGAGSSTISNVTNVGDGTYTFDVTSTTPEKVTYTATADGVTITQTADVTFTAVPPPGPDTGTSTVTANPTTVAADGTTPSTITVTVNDANSNPITDATVTLDDGAGNSTISAVTNVGDGTYTFEVTSTTADTVTYTATADGVTITDTANVTFKVGIADAGTSTVTASPASVAADGTTTSTIIVTVNDANSNPITDATVTPDQGAGSSTISAVTNVGDGTYTFEVSSTTADTVTYTATADGVTITDTASVTFTQTTAEATCLSGAGAAGYGIITINGRNWLDRNLGALQVAVTTNDSDAYGDLYQWGRSTEGHQVRTSDTNDTVATTLDDSDVNTNWYGKFIVGANDWADTSLDDNGSIRSQSWSTPYDQNQVCPCGYVVPTIQDFLDLNMTAPNTTDTFKLTTAGWRENIDGNITQENSRAYFWTTTTVAPNRSTVYGYIPSNNSEAQYVISKRANGYSIRCIKP